MVEPDSAFVSRLRLTLPLCYDTVTAHLPRDGACMSTLEKSLERNLVGGDLSDAGYYR